MTKKASDYATSLLACLEAEAHFRATMPSDFPLHDLTFKAGFAYGWIGAEKEHGYEAPTPEERQRQKAIFKQAEIERRRKSQIHIVQKGGGGSES